MESPGPLGRESRRHCEHLPRRWSAPDRVAGFLVSGVRPHICLRTMDWTGVYEGWTEGEGYEQT
jgi:hypothetical protein